MPERIRERGSRRGRQHLALIGSEVRAARRAAGLSQAVVADASGMSRAEVSRIERGAAPWLSVLEAAELCAVVGLDLWLRAYPGADPLRDAAHVALLRRFLGSVGGDLRVRLEVALDRPGDLRAWDATISDRRDTVGVEAETRISDAQAMERRLALKRRDGRIDRVILVIADTRANRSMLRSIRPTLRADYPLDTAEIVAALASGRLPRAGGICLM